MRALRPFSAFALSLLIAVAASVLARAQNSLAPQVSEAITADLGKLRELTEAKSYPPALALIDRLLGKARPESYDRALLSQIKAQILLAEGRYSDAIAPLEDALRLTGRNPGFMPEPTALDSLFLLAQLHQQAASDSKDLAHQRASLARAADHLRRWQTRAPRPTPDGQRFAASLLYQQATLDPDNLDDRLLAEAQRAAREGLVLQLQPPADLYVLLLASHQQRGEHAEAAELLELLLQRNPDNVGYWQQLVSTYLALAASAKHEREADIPNLRALLALERAQARGLLDSPKEQFNRVALLLNLRQLEPAINLLEKGLADRTLENTRRNWEVLANAYQQTGREPDALVVLQRAVTALPADGQLEFTLAQLFYASGRVADTRRHLELAVKKGGLDKPGQTHLFLAYAAYELRDHAAAARHAREAAAFDDTRKEDLARLTQAITEAAAAESTVPAPVTKP